MAEVRPFRALRYNQEAVGDLSLVVAPPYDVIGEEERDALYNKHPYNVIRLILNRHKKGEAGTEGSYKRAAEFLQRWTAQRIIIHDAEPAVYLYRQRYILESGYKECTGMVARVRLADFSEGIVLPHEDIMPKPFEDRLKLLELTGTNLSMVEALYSDPAEKLKKPIQAEMDRFPLSQFQTVDGIAHDVWAVTDERFIKKMTDFFRGKPLYIADGHHRYSTALEYSRRVGAETSGGDDPRNYLMMLIVEMENPGLSLLPVHRVVSADAGIDSSGFVSEIEKWFTIEEISVPDGSRSGQVFHVMRELERAGESGRAYGVYLRDQGRFLLIRWKPGLDLDRLIEGEFSDAYRELDVTVLHKLIFEKVLRLEQDRASVEKNLMFTRDPLEAMRVVDSDRGEMAFFLNPTRVEQVGQVADRGERMPQKSTYFYPKPCSGVLMNRIGEW